MAKTLADILASKGVIGLPDVSVIKKEAKEKRTSVESVLYERGVSEVDVAEAKSALSGYPVRYLEGRALEGDILKTLPEESARTYRIVPLGKDEGYIDIGMLDPDDVSSQEAVKFLATKLHIPARIFIITPSDFSKVLQQYQNAGGEITQALGEFKKEFGKAPPRDTYQASAESAREGIKITEEAPLTKIVSVIIRHAVEGRASDIHIEPSKDKLRVRFRVDGVLHTSLTLPVDTHPQIVTRIKVMTNLKIDETRIPQDGRFSTELMGHDIDFRVSTFPTSYGEKVVIRILNPAEGLSSFAELGYDGRNLEILKENFNRPYGLILITGPTGSGKSTTLYTILQALNEEGSNIVSLEDPIEYYVPGVNQSQIRPEIGYDFATGLRHILRQDPDIIMVGEIRDKETAAMAIHSALTGHLVLSTLHTNNAIGVIPRLIDMGVDPYLIPPTLILVAGQRLARRLCADSRKAVKISGRAKEIISQELAGMPEAVRKSVLASMPQEIYQPEVSSTCPKGTRGRIGVFEILVMTPELEKIILTAPSDAAIAEEARRQGMITMRQDGIQKVLKGIIGLEELLEVI